MNDPHITPPDESRKLSLIGLTLAELQDICRSEGLPSYAAKQMMEWLYTRRVASIDAMTNLSKVARQQLALRYDTGITPPVEAIRSADGTVKYLFEVCPTNNRRVSRPEGSTASASQVTSEDLRRGYVEAVYIPDGERATLCVSSQVGCRMHCQFCMTGRQGWHGDLSAGDILNQVLAIPESERLTNVVLMGMGEPMDNLDAVVKALSLMTSTPGMGWSPRRITVSTVGVRGTLERFIHDTDCHLAISLHAPSPAVRSALMPAERLFSMTEMLELLRHYDWSGQRRLSFEYILFSGINDTPADARRLVRALDGLPCRVNLIRFHRIPDTDLDGVDSDGMTRFRDYLTQHGVFTTIRASRGEDVMAACGMLSTAKNGSLPTGDDNKTTETGSTARPRTKAAATRNRDN